MRIQKLAVEQKNLAVEILSYFCKFVAKKYLFVYFRTSGTLYNNNRNFHLKRNTHDKT